MLIFDWHLDLAWNALEWNRDLRWSQERIRRWELSMNDKIDRGNNTVCFPEMRRGGVGICVATQIARNSGYFHKLPGWSSPAATSYFPHSVRSVSRTTNCAPSFRSMFLATQTRPVVSATLMS